MPAVPAVAPPSPPPPAPPLPAEPLLAPPALAPAASESSGCTGVPPPPPSLHETMSAHNDNTQCVLRNRPFDRLIVIARSLKFPKVKVTLVNFKQDLGGYCFPS
jgi:hypothetical protein